jgi:hypothetical protein
MREAYQAKLGLSSAIGGFKICQLLTVCFIDWCLMVNVRLDAAVVEDDLRIE